MRRERRQNPSCFIGQVCTQFHQQTSLAGDLWEFQLRYLVWWLRDDHAQPLKALGGPLSFTVG